MKEQFKNALFSLSLPVLNRISPFRNRHKGEACYIVGDGISIKYFDLGNFSDKISIVGNYIPFHKDFERLDARYCVVSAPFFFSPILGYGDPVFKKYLYNMSRHYRPLIKKYRDKSFFINLSNYPFISRPNIYYTFKKFPAKHLPDNFISNRIDCFRGVLRNSVAMAVYMGFSHIYLVGCDYTFSPTQHLHWYESGVGVLADMPDYEKDFFNVAKEFVDITTVTLSGESRVLKYISYQDLTGNEPTYRENTQIINEEYLHTLKTWPGYKIV